MEQSRCPLSETQTASKACPFSGASPSSRDPPSQPASCPFGYGASQAPALTDMHCVICKLYLYDAVLSTNCKHIFCRGCILRFAECPVCGADVVHLKPDITRQGMVDRFLQHHATADAIRQLASTDPTLKGAIPRDEAHPAASLALHLGMCSMAAGNLSAALARCSAAAKQLKETIDSTHGMSMAMMRMQMGTALGCMGDCQKRMGDVQHAVQCYQDSITCLEHAIAAPPPEDGDEHHDDDGTPDQLHSTLVIELQQALSVSWSKLGDVWYLQDALPNATRCYHHVLQLRKQLINATPNPPPGMLLDVAVALTKLADVAQATGDMRQVGVFVKQAHDVAGSLAVVVEGEECKEEMQGGMGVKYAALMAALGSLAVGDGGGTSENGDEVGDEEGDEEG